jgi:hypothetical protein
MKKEVLKKYLPVTLFTTLIETIIYEIGYTYNF